MNNTCIAPGCTRTDIKARQMCHRHYQAWLAGNPMSFPIPDARDEPYSPWCECPTPDQQPVTIFGWIRLVDVTECVRCHRPPKAEAA